MIIMINNSLKIAWGTPRFCHAPVNENNYIGDIKSAEWELLSMSIVVV